MIDRRDPVVQRLRKGKARAACCRDCSKWIVDRCHMESFVTSKCRKYATTGSSSASVSCIAGIRHPGLMCLRVFDPGAQIFGRVRQHAGGQIVSRLIRCVRSGPNRPPRAGASYRVAIDA